MMVDIPCIGELGFVIVDILFEPIDQVVISGAYEDGSDSSRREITQDVMCEDVAHNTGSLYVYNGHAYRACI